MTIITNTGGVAYNSTKNIAIAPNGSLYCCFVSNVGGYSQVIVYKSIDDGNIWVDTNFPQLPTYVQSHPSIAIDSNNICHIVWYGKDLGNPTYDQIKYSNNASGFWSSWVNIQPISGYSQRNPSMAIDSNDKLHVVWRGLDSENSNRYQIKYSNNILGYWSNWVNVSPINGHSQASPIIVIDSSDKLHVIWRGPDSENPSYDQIKYSTNVLGSWSNWVNIQPMTGYLQYYPTMAIDSNNSCHVVWHGPDSENSDWNIKYSNNISGYWSNWVNIQVIGEGYWQLYPTITIDSNDKCHVVWHGVDPEWEYDWYKQIKYSNNANGSWSTWINLTSDIDAGIPNCIINSDKLYILYGDNNTGETHFMDHTVSAGPSIYAPSNLQGNLIRSKKK